MDKQALLVAIAMITDKHGCTIIEIDVKKDEKGKKIKSSVSCPDKKSKALCAVELGELFESYTTEGVNG